MDSTAKIEALQNARDTIQLAAISLGLHWRKSRKLDRLVFDLLGLAECGETRSALSPEDEKLLRERNAKQNG